MGGDIAVSPVQIRTSIRKHKHVAQLTAHGAVPKARAAYAIYTAEFWANASASDRSKRKDLFKDAAAKWNAMSAEEKNKYTEQSQQEFRRRRIALVLWDAKQGHDAIDGPAPRTSGGRVTRAWRVLPQAWMKGGFCTACPALVCLPGSMQDLQHNCPLMI